MYVWRGISNQPISQLCSPFELISKHANILRYAIAWFCNKFVAWKSMNILWLNEPWFWYCHLFFFLPQLYDTFKIRSIISQKFLVLETRLACCDPVPLNYKWKLFFVIVLEVGKLNLALSMSFYKDVDLFFKAIQWHHQFWIIFLLLEYYFFITKGNSFFWISFRKNRSIAKNKKEYYAFFHDRICSLNKI